MGVRSSKPGFRLVRRSEVLLPTFLGWLVILVTGIAIFFVVVNKIYPFLAVTSPVSGGDLVVEGWIPDYAFEQVIAEFKRHQYRKLYVTGGPIPQDAFCCGYACGYKTYSEVGAAILRAKGLDVDKVQAVPAPYVDRDRTYASAIALRNWQRMHVVTPASYHVMSIGPHARRTRLMFEKALGDDAMIGITAIKDPSYDPENWWNSSVGVRAVVAETIAYLYARLLFLQHDQ